MELAIVRPMLLYYYNKIKSFDLRFDFHFDFSFNLSKFSIYCIHCLLKNFPFIYFYLLKTHKNILINLFIFLI